MNDVEKLNLGKLAEAYVVAYEALQDVYSKYPGVSSQEDMGNSCMMVDEIDELWKEVKHHRELWLGALRG